MWSRRTAQVVASAVCAAVALALATPAEARTVNDPGLSRQWGVAKIGAPQAWDRATGAGTVVAVIDSGVDLNHEDLVAKLLPGKDFTGKGSVQDDCGHGSHVSGIAAASTNNGRGVAGVAPDAKILPLKVLSLDEDPTSPNYGECVGNGQAVEDAIMWAADRGATVINLSLGSDIQFLTTPGLAEPLRYAWGKGAIPVVAAGNQFILGSGYSDEPAIVVTATTPTDTKPTYSSTTGGARWSMSAPGGAGTGDDRDVLSAYYEAGKSNAYALLAGTSMATPHVAGAAAVLRSMGLTPQQTVDRLLSTAVDLGTTGKDNTFGSGRLDLAKAVATGGGTAPTTAAPTTAAKPASGNAPPTTARRSGAGVTNAPTRVTGGTGAVATTVASGSISAPSATLPGEIAAPAPPKVVIDVDGGGSGTSSDPPGALLALAGAGLLASLAGTAWTLRSARAATR